VLWATVWAADERAASEGLRRYEVLECAEDATKLSAAADALFLATEYHPESAAWRIAGPDEAGRLRLEQTLEELRLCRPRRKGRNTEFWTLLARVVAVFRGLRLCRFAFGSCSEEAPTPGGRNRLRENLTVGERQSRGVSGLSADALKIGRLGAYQGVAARSGLHPEHCERESSLRTVLAASTARDSRGRSVQSKQRHIVWNGQQLPEGRTLSYLARSSTSANDCGGGAVATIPFRNSREERPSVGDDDPQAYVSTYPQAYPHIRIPRSNTCGRRRRADVRWSSDAARRHQGPPVRPGPAPPSSEPLAFPSAGSVLWNTTQLGTARRLPGTPGRRREMRPVRRRTGEVERSSRGFRTSALSRARRQAGRPRLTTCRASGHTFVPPADLGGGGSPDSTAATTAVQLLPALRNGSTSRHSCHGRPAAFGWRGDRRPCLTDTAPNRHAGAKLPRHGSPCTQPWACVLAGPGASVGWVFCWVLSAEQRSLEKAEQHASRRQLPQRLPSVGTADGLPKRESEQTAWRRPPIALAAIYRASCVCPTVFPDGRAQARRSRPTTIGRCKGRKAGMQGGGVRATRDSSQDCPSMDCARHNRVARKL